MKLYRYNTYENRSFEMQLDVTTIESIVAVDGRQVRSQVRTKSGDVIDSCDDYATLIKRWDEITRWAAEAAERDRDANR